MGSDFDETSDQVFDQTWDQNVHELGIDFWIKLALKCSPSWRPFFDPTSASKSDHLEIRFSLPLHTDMTSMSTRVDDQD